MNLNKIKIEPGTSKLPTVIKFEEGRLPSLVTKNLKLGASAKPKPAFKPNLVERKKKDAPTAVENNIGRGKPRTRGGDRGDRGRGALRGRQSNNFIQSQGVFAEGMSEGQRKSNYFSDRTHGSKDHDASKSMDKPAFNRKAEYKIDKEHEEKVMLDLYDDHIDQDNEITNEIYPISLPLVPQIKVKKEPEIEHFEGANDCKSEIKPENFLSDIQDKLILFQFPDCLPGIGPAIEPEKTPNSPENTDKEPERNKCTLKDVNEGKIGKIVIYNSGKTKLVIGNTTFDIDEGYQPGFLQDVISVNVNTETKSGDMINLGCIENSLVVTPQFDSLLTK